jgi:NAD(P)-dependent dehydrogenase (short-subunit alcohol dehydrogenase family)
LKSLVGFLMIGLSHIGCRNVALAERVACANLVTGPPAGNTAIIDKPRKLVMEKPKYRNALIVGAGSGLSASLARLFSREGIEVALAARSIEKLGALCTETGARAFACNATDGDEVARLFGLVEREIGTPDVVVYNASARARGPFLDLVPSEVEHAIAVSAFGGFLVAQQAAKRMLPNRHGAILFTGASASVKGYAQSAPFAMGKFALRGLAQSMARELSPQGIHVAHFVIDGGIRSAVRAEPADRPDSMLDPDAIALSYWNVLQQPRSAWSWEVELRPWVEKF